MCTTWTNLCPVPLEAEISGTSIIRLFRTVETHQVSLLVHRGLGSCQ